MFRSRSLALCLVGAIVIFAAFVWPTASLLRDAAGAPGGGASAPSARQSNLLLRGILLAGAGSAAAISLGAALAAGLVAPSAWLRTGSRALAAFTLLTPTYLIAYAWSLPLLPEGLPIGGATAGIAPDWLTRDARAIVCLGIWLSPIAAALLAEAWSGPPSRAYRQTLLDAAPARAFRAALGPLRVPTLSLFLLLLALGGAEYAIPHLCLRPTWNTELLAQLQLREQPALLAAWPGLVLNTALVAVSWGLRPAQSRTDAALADLAVDDGNSARTSAPRSAIALAIGAWLILLSPVFLLLRYLHHPNALLRVASLYAADWADGLAYAGIGAVACAVVGWTWLLLATAGGAGRALAALLFIAALIGAVAPPAIVGEGQLLAMGSHPWLRDTLLPIACVGAARFAIIPIILAALSLRETRSTGLLDSAAVDGAARDAQLWKVVVPRSATALIVGAFAAGILIFGEIAGSILVIPPGVGSVARSLLNEIHFGRNDDVIALSIWTLAISAVAAALATRFRAGFETARKKRDNR